jgi:hypothetical protein
MPVHDWARVDAGVFHDFHTWWIVHLREALNGGLLPSGYYAMSEQHAGRYIADILTLHVDQPAPAPDRGVAVLDAPPRTRTKRIVPAASSRLRRTLTIRHISGHRVVALLEIVSPGNKDRAESVEAFAAKVIAALDVGVHVLIVDLFPPGKHDPLGMAGAVWEFLAGGGEEPWAPATTEPLTLASFVATLNVEIYQESLAVGMAMPEMPLFLSQERYVNVPLASTYDAAFRGMPEIWRETLERP